MGGEFILQSLFGITSTPLNLWLKFGRVICIKFLKKHPLSKVKVPTAEKIDEYKEAINEKYPLLKDVYCFADGLKLYIQAAGNQQVMQEMFYNGWTHAQQVILAIQEIMMHCISNRVLFRGRAEHAVGTERSFSRPSICGRENPTLLFIQQLT